MTNIKYLQMLGLVLIVAVAGCWTEQEVITDLTTDTDVDSDSDTDSDTGSDTGSDSDSASDSDSESDDGCEVPSGITDWGGPCHTTADCPPNTECIIINSLDDTQGFCAAECCNLETADTDYCTDVSTGLEGCYFFATDDEGWEFPPPYHCMIFCNTQADCPIDTACTETDYGTLICYGYAS